MEEGEGATDTDPDFGEESTDVEKSANVSQVGFTLVQCNAIHVSHSSYLKAQMRMESIPILEKEQGVKQQGKRVGFSQLVSKLSTTIFKNGAPQVLASSHIFKIKAN